MIAIFASAQARRDRHVAVQVIDDGRVERLLLLEEGRDDVAHVTLSYHIMPGGLRMHRAGWRVVYVPQAVVAHLAARQLTVSSVERVEPSLEDVFINQVVHAASAGQPATDDNA